MRILVLTGHDDVDYGPVGAESWKSYAEKHGYSFVCARNFDPLEGRPSWQKLRIILEHLPHYDWVFWTDADSVCTNMEINLTDLTSDNHWLIASQDWNEKIQFSAGHMLIANQPYSHKFIEHARSLEHWTWSRLGDSPALQETMEDLGGVGIMILPRRVMNAVPADAEPRSVAPWEPGDFLAHITGNRALRRDKQRRLDLLKKYSLI